MTDPQGAAALKEVETLGIHWHKQKEHVREVTLAKVATEAQWGFIACCALPL